MSREFWDRTSNFGKEYLKLLVDKIRIVKEEVHVSGILAALTGALCSGSGEGSFERVPTPVMFWLRVCNLFYNSPISRGAVKR